VKSRTTRKFWRLFDDLPGDVQEHARRAYGQFAADPATAALNFKRVDRREPVYSVRIGISYRALGLLEGDTVTWFWIGIHDDYARILKS
jgi:hypothetical protein